MSRGRCGLLMPRFTARGFGARAFLLLEVVVAVALLVLGMAVIGAQLQSAADTTYATDHLARLVFLAESRMAELDSGLVVPNEQLSEDTAQVEIEQDFGREFPEYASRVTLAPTATADLIAVQLDLFYDPQRVIIEHGAVLEEFDYADEKIAQTYHTLRAAPKPLNLKTDFGLEDDLAEQINGQLAESSMGGTLDVENFNPAVFKDLSTEELIELLSILQQAFGTDQAALLQLVPESMRGQLEALMRGLDAASGGGGGEGTGGETGDGGTGGVEGGTGGGGAPGADGAGRRGGRDAGRGGERGADRRNSDKPPSDETAEPSPSAAPDADGGSDQSSGGRRGNSRSSGGARRGGGG